MSTVVRQVVTAADWEACRRVRHVVFVEEQHVPVAEEYDSHDATAVHFLAVTDVEPVGTARVVMKGAVAKIGRVAVLRAWRGRGVGVSLIRAAETVPAAEGFALDAQVHAIGFYERLGYRAVGEIFMDAGIPHRHMVKAG